MSTDRAAYESYDGFLKVAIRSYWDEGRGSKVNFLALLLASREAWSVAWDELREPGVGKKVLGGAAGAAAAMVVIRLILGGPLGLLLTGASVASLGVLYARHHRLIWAQQGRYRELLLRYRKSYEEVRSDYLAGKLRDEQRDLMVDGLLGRLLAEIDEAPEGLDEEPAEEPSAKEAGKKAKKADKKAKKAGKEAGKKAKKAEEEPSAGSENPAKGFSSFAEKARAKETGAASEDPERGGQE